MPEAEAAPGVQKLMELNGLGAENRGHALDGGVLTARSTIAEQLADLSARLAGTPWKSGSIDHEQGVSMGNHRLRQTMIQWLGCGQSTSRPGADARWYRERTKGATKLQKKKIGRRAGAQAARGAVAIRRRRRRDRGAPG